MDIYQTILPSYSRSRLRSPTPENIVGISQPVIADENNIRWTFLNVFLLTSTAQRSQRAQAEKRARADQSATTQASGEVPRASMS